MNPAHQSIWRLTVCLAIVLSAAMPALAVTDDDFCACLDSPNSLGDFRASDAGTYPTEWRNGATITIPLPMDGKLVFDSFIVDKQPGSMSGVTVRFEPNASNDPVRLLVRSDVMIASGSFVLVDGFNASGNAPGAGGPGGFRGGEGAFEAQTQTLAGGAGLGPAGGLPGVPDGETAVLRSGEDGGFLISASLNPLIGGSGGGGGSTVAFIDNCKGGGGGGGGGSILIAANGTITVDGLIRTQGGFSPGYVGSCANSGGSGASGAIHLVADTIAGVTGSISATTSGGVSGIVRMQAKTITFPDHKSTPVAILTYDPGPVLQVPTPSLVITGVGGQPVSELPQGGFGGIDVIISTVDPVAVTLSSEFVPGGTQVLVSAKPRTGGDPIPTTATLDNCTADGVCAATAMLELDPGAYFIEARALFK